MMLSGRCLAMSSRRGLMMVGDVRRTVVRRVEIRVITVRAVACKTGMSGSGAGVITGRTRMIAGRTRMIAGRARVKAGRARVIGSCRMKRAVAPSSGMATASRMPAATACMSAAATACIVSERRKR